MHQGLLFPDGFHILEQALVALRDLDIPKAEELVRRARAAQPNLVNLDLVAAASEYLRDALPGPAEPDACAATLVAIPKDIDAGRLREDVGNFVDQVLARYLMRMDPDGPFVDHAASVPWARVLLLVGQPDVAHRNLAELVALHPRADLWWALGDAALGVDRETEANAAFVRALVLDPQAVDCFRLQHKALLRCYQQLRERHDGPSAREALLPTAWIDGVLEIPSGNRWFEAAPGADPRRTESTTHSHPATPSLRRFAHLLFADRTAGPGNVDVARREEMACLAPDLFARYFAECQRRERR